MVNVTMIIAYMDPMGYSLLVGGLNPSEKYESQLGWLFPIYGKIKNGNQTTNQPV